MANITIGVINPAETEKVTMQVPNDVPVGALIESMVEQMALPSRGQNGRRLRYHLSARRENGRLERLDEGTSLEENNVQDKGVLQLTVEMVAAGSLWKFDLRNRQTSPAFQVTVLNTEELVTPCRPTESTFVLKVTLYDKAFQAISDHADSDLEHEVIGLLLGTVCQKGAGVEVTVVQALAGYDAPSTKVSVRFSYEAWKHVLEEKANHYSDLITVGWYHTHPGFGTFFSSMDEFIHQKFFDKPWQIALVVDPIRDEWTFFQHEQGEVERRQRFTLLMPDGTSRKV